MALAKGSARESADLAVGRERIVELERKVGQQQLDLDLLQQALRHFKACPRTISGLVEYEVSRISKSSTPQLDWAAYRGARRMAPSRRMAAALR